MNRLFPHQRVVRNRLRHLPHLPPQQLDAVAPKVRVKVGKPAKDGAADKLVRRVLWQPKKQVKQRRIGRLPKQVCRRVRPKVKPPPPKPLPLVVVKQVSVEKVVLVRPLLPPLRHPKRPRPPPKLIPPRNMPLPVAQLALLRRPVPPPSLHTFCA